MSRKINVILAAGLMGGVIFTFFASKIIPLLFTPPVNFGVNCEPAAQWTMSKLIASQGVGVVFGAVGGIAYMVVRRRKDADQNTAPTNQQR